MKSRLSIRTREKFVNFEDTPQGMIEAIMWRQDHPEYKFKRIQHVLQTIPEEIETGIEYLCNVLPITKA